MADDFNWDRSKRTQPIYPPYEKIVPYPKWLVINIYGEYILESGKSICITSTDQLEYVEPLQVAVAELGFHWDIRVQDFTQDVPNAGVQIEIKPLKFGISSYSIDIEYEIIRLTANDLFGLENAVTTLIQVMHLSCEEFRSELASMWIRDWH